MAPRGVPPSALRISDLPSINMPELVLRAPVAPSAVLDACTQNVIRYNKLTVLKQHINEKYMPFLHSQGSRLISATHSSGFRAPKRTEGRQITHYQI